MKIPPHPLSKNSQRKKLRGSTYGNAYHLASIEAKKQAAEERRRYIEQWCKDHPDQPDGLELPRIALDCLTLDYGVSPLSMLHGVKPFPDEVESGILERQKDLFKKLMRIE